MKTTNRQANYYAPYGSYDGTIKIQGQWIRATGLNRINKTGWIRWQGPPSETIILALKNQKSTSAVELFPDLVRFPGIAV